MAGKIFVNYRREDDPGFTQALYHHLEREFANDEVFMDVEGHIKPGDDFLAVINAQVDACEAFLAVIGPRWLELLASRADDPTDFVVTEIKLALQLGKRLIPVLVGGAIMPSLNNLPEPIQSLAGRQAANLRPDRFKADCQSFVADLKRGLAAKQTRPTARTKSKRTTTKQEPSNLEMNQSNQATGVEVQSRPNRLAGTRKQNGKYKNGAAPSDHNETGGEKGSSPDPPPGPSGSGATSSSAKGPAVAAGRLRRLPIALAILVPGTIALLAVSLPLMLSPQPSAPPDTLLPEMVRLQGGCFAFGSPTAEPGREDDEHLAEQRCVAPFSIGRYEVTVAEFDRFAQQSGISRSDRGPGEKRLPAVRVTWADAAAYAAWLSEETGRRFRLPTENEWEFAARGGSSTAFWWGDDVDPSQAVCGECLDREVSGPRPVGSLNANPYGLYDTAGNVWEWVRSEETDGPVLRGGAFDTSIFALRSANRGHPAAPQVPDPAVGLRLAEDL